MSTIERVAYYCVVALFKAPYWLRVGISFTCWMAFLVILVHLENGPQTGFDVLYGFLALGLFGVSLCGFISTW